MKTLQEQYNLISEGKGSKQEFLKQARYLFPDLINVYNSYNDTINILKDKRILNESNAGLGMVSTHSRRVEDWVSIFQESVKAEEKKTSKEVTDTQKHNFDYKDVKNIDNLYGNAFLNGFYVEMQDPKNHKKSVDEVKQIVAKNLGKDFNYYAKNAQFGIKGIGYTDEAPGLGEPKEPKGKYKSSGYGDLPKKKLKESLNENKKEREFIKHLEDLAKKHGLITPEEVEDEDAKIHDKIINALYNIYDKKFYNKETFTDTDYKSALDMLAHKIKRSLTEDSQVKLKPQDIKILDDIRKNHPNGITPSNFFKKYPNIPAAYLYKFLVTLAKEKLLNFQSGNKIPPHSIENLIDSRKTQIANALTRPGHFNEITVNNPNDNFKVDKSYTHFALDKKDNKILTGWEYENTDPEDIKYYSKQDLIDMDVKPSDYSILSVKALKQKGINPFSWSSWKKNNDIKENTEPNNDFKIDKKYAHFALDENEEEDDYLEFSDGETIVSMFKDRGQWVEGKVIDGEKPYGWGSKKYMGYLKPDQIAQYLRSDYGGNWKSI